MDYSRARAYCACSRCGWVLFGHFYSHLSLFSYFPSLWETTRYRLKYSLKGSLSPNTTNQPLQRAVKPKTTNQPTGSGGAIVLGKLAVLGRPTNLVKSGARAYCACSRCGRGCLDIFSLIFHFSSLCISLGDGRYRLKYCLKGPFNSKQPTNPHWHTQY